MKMEKGEWNEGGGKEGAETKREPFLFRKIFATEEWEREREGRGSERKNEWIVYYFCLCVGLVNSCDTETRNGCNSFIMVLCVWFVFACFFIFIFFLLFFWSLVL